MAKGCPGGISEALLASLSLAKLVRRFEDAQDICRNRRFEHLRILYRVVMVGNNSCEYLTSKVCS